MRIRIAVLATLLTVTILGCAREGPLGPGAGPPLHDLAVDRLDRLAAERDGGVGEATIGHRTVVVPAGSVDALANAIAEAGPGGAVVLAPGVHTENASVTIGHPVLVLGLPGSELRTGSPLVPPATTVQPSLHVLDAPGVVLWNLTLRPIGGDGGGGIVIERSPRSLVFGCSIEGFQFPILLHRSDHARVISNRVATTTLWQTGAVLDAYRILAVSGDGVLLHRNSARDAVFGLWVCGRNGRATGNSATASLVGLILCKVPDGALPLPGGAVGSDAPATAWTVRENVTTGNFTTGLLAIDGAQHNRIESNASSANGTYDIELAGDSFRFGFLTPASHHNTFVAGRYPTVEIKNCGIDNTVIGGALVDNSVEPCD